MIEEGSGAVVRDARNSREKGEGRKRVLNFAEKPEVAFQQGASYPSSTDLKDERQFCGGEGMREGRCKIHFVSQEEEPKKKTSNRRARHKRG